MHLLFSLSLHNCRFIRQKMSICCHWYASGSNSYFHVFRLCFCQNNWFTDSFTLWKFQLVAESLMILLLYAATSIDSTMVILSLYECTYCIFTYNVWSYGLMRYRDACPNRRIHEEKYINYSVFIFHCKFYWFGLGLIVSNYSIVFEFVFFICRYVSLVYSVLLFH